MRDLGLESKVTKAHADAAKKILKGQITKFVKESEDLEEAIKWWTVTITKKAGKLFKGQTVDVKANNSAEAIKKGIKQMKGDPVTVPSGSVDAVLGESLKEAAKPSNGKSTVGIDVTDIKSAMKDIKKFKLTGKEGKGNGSAAEVIVTGKNADIFKYLTSKSYNMDTAEVEEFYPELYESVDLEEAVSQADIKKILAAAKKAGGDIKGNQIDFGMGAVIDVSIEKGKIKLDAGKSNGVEYFKTAKDAVMAFESVDFDLEEAFSRLPGNVINNELYVVNRAIQQFTSSQKNGDDVDEKKLNQLIKALQVIKKEVKQFNNPEDVPVKYQYKSK
jgi:3D (Asp-Asp-Asp) domain-containing protein